jgi:hypothetical protein
MIKMSKQEIEFEKETETKNTVRYAEVTNGNPPYIDHLYIQKWALKPAVPDKIKLTIEW